MKSLKFLTLSLVALGLTSVGQARIEKGEQPIFLEFARPLGMGGAFTAIADDHNSFSFNPAGLVQRTGSQFTLLEIGGGFSKDTQDVLDFISDNESKLTDWDNVDQAEQIRLLNEINGFTDLDPRVIVNGNVGSYLSGPSFMGLPFHVGLGAQAKAEVSKLLLAEGAGGFPNISFEANNDVLIPLTIAKRWEAPWIMPGNLGVGLTGKYIQRRQIKQDRVQITALQDVDEPPIADGDGIGADLGFLYQPTNRFNLGVMVRDIGGTKISFDVSETKTGWTTISARDTVIRPRTNVGIALIPESLLWLIPTGDRLTLAADVRDVLDSDKHIIFENGLRKPFGEDLFKQTHLGAEYRYWFLRFRGGAYQGYPSFGLGVDVPFIKLDIAYYSQELGARAGDRRQENVFASLAIAFGTGEVESRERISKRKEMKKQRNMSGSESQFDSAPVTETAPKENKMDSPVEESMPEDSDMDEEIPE